MTNPTLVTTPFAENGDKNTIPQSVGAEPQNATQDEGFPEVTQTPISAGGIPPERKDFNGILNLYGQHIVHLNKGLPYEFDAAFATAIGGYPLHARIMLSNGDIVRNTVANNSNNPNSDMTGWVLANNLDNILYKTSLTGGVDRTVKSKLSDILSVKDFGAKGDGSTNDTIAIAAAHNAAKTIGATVFFPNGTYILSGINDVSNDNVSWYGESKEGVIIRLTTTSINLQSTPTTKVLSGSNLRNTNTLNLTDASGLGNGGVIFLSASEVVETTRNESIKREVHLISSVSSNSLTLSDALFFDFSATDNQSLCRVYQNPRKVSISNMTFVCVNGNSHGRSVTLTGIANCKYFDNVVFKSTDTSGTEHSVDSYLIQESINCYAENVSCQYIRYGNMTQTCRNVNVNNISGFGCRHLTYPAYWSINCSYTNILGFNNTATADSHSAIAITLRNVKAVGDIESSNNRSFGGTSENWDISILNAIQSSNSVLSVSNQAWVAAYSDKNKSKWDIVLKNINVRFLDGTVPVNAVAVSATTGGNMLIEDVFINKGVTSEVYFSNGSDTLKSVNIVGGNVTTATASEAPRIRSLVRQKTSQNTSEVNMSYEESKFRLRPFSFGRYGVIGRSGLKCAGEIPIKGNVASGNNMILPFEIFDHPNPFATGIGQTNHVVCRLKLKIVQTSFADERFYILDDVILTWKHKYVGTKSVKAAALTAGNFINGGTTGNTLTASISTAVAQIGNTSNTILNNLGISFALSLVNNASVAVQDCRVFYEYESYEVDN